MNNPKNVFSLLPVVLLVLTAPTLAQTPPATPPQPKPQAPRTVTAPRATTSGLTLSIEVTDKSGNGIANVQVGSGGPVDRSGTTAQDGSIMFRAMRPGTYRLRFEREGFITLERELVLRAGQPANVSVALSAAAAKPAPVVLPPVTEPPPTQQPPKSTRVVEPRSLSIPDFAERNLIGSEPQKLTTLGCAEGGTARLLQVRDPLNTQQHNDVDHVLYVVAGAGVIRIRNQDTKAAPGFFALVPRGVPYSIRREGRNPIILMSVLAGAPCPETATPTR